MLDVSKHNYFCIIEGLFDDVTFSASVFKTVYVFISRNETQL